MTPRRWIVVDTSVSREESGAGGEYRYLGRRGWAFTIIEADPFDSRDAAEKIASGSDVRTPRICSVRPSAIRRELDGLRATDAECAARLAAVTAERDAAVRELADVRRAIEVLITKAGCA